MVLAIIQARMGSTRLPGKVMYPLIDKTVIEHVYNRVRQSKLINWTIIATTKNSKDDRIVELCKDRNIEYFRGSEEDVLDRYYQAARKYEPDHVVRITCDCPLIDAEVIDKVIAKHLADQNDDTCNTDPMTYPDGLDVEIMTMQTLENCWFRSSLREHVTEWIRMNDSLKKFNVRSDVDMSDKRWTLDYKEDYVFLIKVYEGCYNGLYFGMNDVLEFLKKNPELEKINKKHVKRQANEKAVYFGNASAR